jgi:hypothetical protein
VSQEQAFRNGYGGWLFAQVTNGIGRGRKIECDQGAVLKQAVARPIQPLLRVNSNAQHSAASSGIFTSA